LSSRAIISRTNLPQQFDEYVWFDETRAVTPLDTAEIKGLPDTYPRRLATRRILRGSMAQRNQGSFSKYVPPAVQARFICHNQTDPLP
jgi:hypothetical protein